MDELLKLVADPEKMLQSAISSEKQSLDILLKLLDIEDELDIYFFSFHLDHWLLLFYRQISRQKKFATWTQELQILLEEEFSPEYVCKARHFLERMSAEVFPDESPAISVKILDHA